MTRYFSGFLPVDPSSVVGNVASLALLTGLSAVERLVISIIISGGAAEAAAGTAQALAKGKWCWNTWTIGPGAADPSLEPTTEK